MLARSLTQAEKNGLANLKRTSLYDLLLEMRTQADRELRGHTDPVLMHRAQGKALFLDEFIENIDLLSSKGQGSL
jgi:hypothetical protein